MQQEKEVIVSQKIFKLNRIKQKCEFIRIFFIYFFKGRLRLGFEFGLGLGYCSLFEIQIPEQNLLRRMQLFSRPLDGGKGFLQIQGDAKKRSKFIKVLDSTWSTEKGSHGPLEVLSR